MKGKEFEWKPSVNFGFVRVIDSDDMQLTHSDQLLEQQNLRFMVGQVSMLHLSVKRIMKAYPEYST